MMNASSPCLLDSPSSSTSALHTVTTSPKRTFPPRAISQQFDETTRPPHPSGRRSSTRRAMRRLSRLFHRVRDQFVAHIPLFSPTSTPPPICPSNKDENEEQNKTFIADPVNTIEQPKNVDQFLITEDYIPNGDSSCITVYRGERVELLDQFSSTDQDVIAVAVIDEKTNQPSTRRGNVPMKILFHIDNNEASCSTDRPQIENNHSGSSSTVQSKRTSLRRFFQNSTKDNSTNNRKTSPIPKDSPTSHKNSIVGSINQDNQQQHSSIEDSTIFNNNSTDKSDNHIDQYPMSSQNIENQMEDPIVDIQKSSLEENGENNHINNEQPKKTPQEEARYKRQFVIQELVDTERDYVTDLTLIVEGYMAALDSTELPEDLQGKDKIIFANIAQILEFHKNTFLKEIEKCLEDYEAAGTAFTKYERRLHTYYVKYCQNKPKSDFLMQQEEFEQFFSETRLKLGQKRTLTDLLIKPVQRIQKYQLLMKDILKYTERAGDSMDKLRKGFEVMCIVPKACDDMMQVGRLQNFDGNLNAQGKLLFQGLLQISEFSPSQPFKGKERIVFLFEQSAIIADSIPKRNEFSSPTYIFKNQIMVNKMVLENNVQDEPTRFILRSSDPNQPIAFLCQANSIEEKEQWLEKINVQLDQQKALLAALVDPKKYQNQLANSMGSLSLGNTKKDSSGSLGTPQTGSPTSSLNSPKHSTPPSVKGSKLFGFNKKSSTNSRGPTSPH